MLHTQCKRNPTQLKINKKLFNDTGLSLKKSCMHDPSELESNKTQLHHITHYLMLL